MVVQHPTAEKVTVTVQVKDQATRSITLEDAFQEPPPRFSFTVRTQAGCVPNDTDLQVWIHQQFKVFKPRTLVEWGMPLSGCQGRGRV